MKLSRRCQLHYVSVQKSGLRVRKNLSAYEQYYVCSILKVTDRQSKSLVLWRSRLRFQAWFALLLQRFVPGSYRTRF
jgi:hypothetical protein